MSLSLNFPTIKPTLNFNFAKLKRLDPRITFTRASSASYFDSSGVLQSATNGVPRFDHNPTTGESLGLLIEEQRTNSIRNNTMQGAVAGAPGTAPTNWQVSTTSNGLSREIVAVDVQNGITYLDIRYSGTTTASSSTVIQPEGGTAVVAATGQSWTASSWLALSGGSTSGLTAIIQRVSGRSSVGGLLEATDTTVTLTDTLVRSAASRTMTNASTARVSSDILLSYSNGAVIDITLRIGLPQLEQGAFATSVISTTGSTATRSPDVPSMTGTNFSSWYNPSEGTILSSYDVTGYNTAAASAFPRVFSISDGTNNNRIIIANTNTGSSLYPYGFISRSSTTQAEFYITAAAFTSNVKRTAAIAYKVNDSNFVTETIAGTTDTNCLIPVVNQLELGSQLGLTFLNGHIRSFSYYPLRFRNSQLQILTD